MKKIVVIVTLCILLLFGCTEQSTLTVDADGVTNINHQNLLSSINTQVPLTESEISALLYMREEEKLAKDVYVFLYNKWQIKAFNNISNAEETHTQAVQSILAAYNIKDPALSQGVFTNPELQELYNSLTTQGSLSEIEALKVGAAIEEIDILDLQKYSKDTNNEVIKTVYANLERGSRNHLRSFVKQMNMRNEIYSPQYLPKEEYQAIITTAIEKGN